MGDIIEQCPECTGFVVLRSKIPEHNLAFVHLQQRPTGWVVWLGGLSFAFDFVLWVVGIVLAFHTPHHSHHLHGWNAYAWIAISGLALYLAILWLIVYNAVEESLDRMLRRAVYLSSAGNMLAATMALLGFIFMGIWRISVRYLMATLSVLQLLNLTAFVSIAVYYYEAHRRADGARSVIHDIMSEQVRRQVFPGEWLVARPIVDESKIQ